MKMDRVDRIISMISDVVVNTYNCGEPLFTNHTTSLSVEKEEVLKKVEQNISNPMSFRGFIKRMQTYNIVCWYPHRSLALQLARRGWENVKDYLVKCCFCAAEMDLIAHVSSPEEELLRLLSRHHTSFCRWLTIASPEFFACVPYVQSSQGLKNTVTATASVLLELGEELPKIPDVVLHKMKLERKTLELLISGLLKDVLVSDVSISAVVLTLCGWSTASTKGVLCCCYCDRRIALRHWMSVQEFDEQRRLMLSSSNDMKICSASYLQNSFADSTGEDDDGSQGSPLSVQSIGNVCSDEEDVEDEEMESDDYEVYDKEMEEQVSINGEEDEIYEDEQSSKIENCQSDKNGKNIEYEKVHGQDNLQGVGEEHFDEQNVHELGESNNEDDDDDEEHTEGELPPNEDGQSDEDAQDVESSDCSIISADEEFNNGNTEVFKGPRKHAQYHSNNDRQEDYDNMVESHYDGCVNEEIDSEDGLIENEGEEEEIEEEENEHDEGEEVGDEDDDGDDEEDDDEDDDDDDDDDDEDDEDDDDDDDDDEMLEDGKFQENDSDKVIELSDSDDEIEPQPKENITNVPSLPQKIQPVMLVETEIVVNEDEVPFENNQSSFEKLSDKTEIELHVNNSETVCTEDAREVKNCEIAARLSSELGNKELENVHEETMVSTCAVEESGINSTQQETCALKRKRDCDEVETEIFVATKKKATSSAECGEDNGNMDLGKTSCIAVMEHNSDDNECKTQLECDRDIPKQESEVKDHSSEAKEIDTDLLKNKCEIGVNSSEGGASVAVIASGHLNEPKVESVEHSLSPAENQDVTSEVPVDTQHESVPLPAASTGETIVGSSKSVAVVQKLVGSAADMATEPPEVQSEDDHDLPLVQEQVHDLEDAASNSPTMKQGVRPGDATSGEVAAVTCSTVDEPIVSSVAQEEDGAVASCEPSSKEEKKEDALPEGSDPLGALDSEGVAVAKEEASSTTQETSKEICETSEEIISCPMEASSVENVEIITNKQLPEACESPKVCAPVGETNEAENHVISSKTESVDGVKLQDSEPSEGNVCSEKSKPPDSRDEEKCTGDKCELEEVSRCRENEANESESALTPEKRDHSGESEAMEVCEAGEQVAGRGVKRDRESESGQALPCPKRPCQSGEVRRQSSLLDPVSEHRFWCLWSMPRDNTLHTQKSGCEIVFQEILEKILQQRQEQDHMDIAGKLRRTQEQIVPL